MTLAALRRAVGAALVAGATAAAAQPRVYANTCIEAQSGDVDGDVVTVDVGTAPPSVLFQWSEGALMAAVPAEATYDPARRRLGFTVPVPAGAFRFDGRLAGHTLAGSLQTPWEDRPRHVVWHLRSAEKGEAPLGACR